METTASLKINRPGFPAKGAACANGQEEGIGQLREEGPKRRPRRGCPGVLLTKLLLPSTLRTAACLTRLLLVTSKLGMFSKTATAASMQFLFTESVLALIVESNQPAGD